MSKFISKNNLDEFDFHDAYITNMNIIDKDMVWLVSDLNVSTKNSQNTNPTDMCIEEAEITFQNYEIKSMKLLGHSSYSDTNELLETVESRFYSSLEIEKELRNSCGRCAKTFNYLNYYKKVDGNSDEVEFLYFDADSVDCLEVVIRFSNVTVKWNDYAGKAWYVDFSKR